MYGTFARRAGARVKATVIFAGSGRPTFVAAARELGLEVVLPSVSLTPGA